MNQKPPGNLILRLHELHLRSQSQPFGLKFVIFQGDQSTQIKLQSRKEITLTNNKAYIEEAFQLLPSKDGKILIIILRTKQKETSFLGQVNLDTHRYMQQGLETINLQSAISKCAEKEENARLLLTLSFPKKQPLREFEIERAMNKEEIKSFRTSTDSVISKAESQETVKAESRRKVSTDLCKRNYKNFEILREDKREKEDSKPRDRSGSYKKRFEYQNGIAAKGKNTIVFMKQKRGKQMPPVAREKTPEPIKLDRLAHSSHSKPKPMKSSVCSRQTTQRSMQKPDKLFISVHAKTQRYQTQSQAMLDQRDHTFSKGSSMKSVEDDKYQSLTDKLRSIEMRIEDKKSVQKLSNRDEESRDSVCTFGDAVKVSHESDLPTISQLKIAALEEKISKLETKASTLQKEKQEKEKLIQKLSFRYQKLVEEIENVKEPCQKEISRLQEEIAKLKKPRPTAGNAELELKNEQRKVLNLQNSLLLKSNEIKHLNLSISLLQDERKQLEVLLAKKESRMGQNSSRAILEAEIMTTGYPSTVKSENELLRSQNLLLQKHVQQLNQLVQQYELHNSKGVNLLKQKQLQDLKAMIALLNQNIEVLQRKSSKLESELRETKLNFAEVMNAVFEKGGGELVDLIERKILERGSGYGSDTQ